MSAEPHIAIVEDDSEIRELVSARLRREGFTCTPCTGGAELDALLARAHIDLIVLDIMMPGEDGLSICRRMAGDPDRPPIIILSAKGDDIDRIVGLEVGADDYLAKPFNPRELVARIRAVLRRGRTAPLADIAPDAHDQPREIYWFEGWTLDVDARALTSPNGDGVELSNGEFALLTAFAQRPKRVLSREQLLDWTRGRDAAPVDRAIDVQLSRLRRKLGDDPRAPALIRTIRGDGYIFSADVRRSAAT